MWNIVTQMCSCNSLVKSDELHIVAFVALPNATLTDCVSVRHPAGQTSGNKGKVDGKNEVLNAANHDAAGKEHSSA